MSFRGSPIHAVQMAEDNEKMQSAASHGQTATPGNTGRSMAALVQGERGVVEAPPFHNGCGDVPSLPGEETAVPPEALNYTPTPDEICKPLGNGHVIRLIFGDLPLTPYEAVEVAKIKAALSDDPSILSTVFSDDHYIVRFYQGLIPSFFFSQERLEHGAVHRRHAQTPFLEARALAGPDGDRCGAAGRGSRHQHSVLSVVLFWLEFAIHKLLVRNRVEQWRVLIDLDQCSALSAPVGTLKDIADTLTRNYRGRLSQMFIVNSGFVFWGLWQLVSVVLPERTKQKIAVYTSNYQADLFSSVNKNQVEGTVRTNLVYSNTHND
ncbi:polyphosphoinositide binding protein [Cystoisospora suis]|uniref:Polyphosphoinositide binding protein n=1 Tax=Cystoisospora suis TaxID=483139 RepID=A0A2C6KZE5_9APIC|nr:polyphosphoinositide binding protein [Cystoisospora suis]